jgi:hypothetical protein
VLAAGFGMMIPLADIAGAINKSDISAATAGTFHRIGDAFFVGAELGLVVPFVAVAVLAWRTRVVPRWWAALGGFAALVLLIGPIGWAALIFGTPIWILGTTVFLLRGPEPGQRGARDHLTSRGGSFRGALHFGNRPVVRVVSS